MRILIDVSLTPRWTNALAAAGHDTIHWSKVGNVEASDREILAWAIEHSYSILTSDLDFAALLAVGSGLRPSVIQIRSDVRHPEALGAVLIHAIQMTAEALADGAILTIDHRGQRLRLLPLRTT